MRPDPGQPARRTHHSPCRTFHIAVRDLPNALRVLYRLREAGYEAFLVGGCVRDLLIGITPEGFRHRDQRAARRGQAHVPQLPAHRPALPAGARVLRPRDHRGGDLPRHERAGVEPTDRATSPPISTTTSWKTTICSTTRMTRSTRPMRARCSPRPDPHQTGFHGGRPLADRDRSRHAGAGAVTTMTRIASPTSTAASCATTPTAPSTTTCGAAISPPTRSTTTSRTSRSGITPAASKTSPRAACKLIGDPVTRYREDPVRMLRAARFEAKLGFTLDGETGTAIARPAGTAGQRAAGAPVRRDAQAVPQRARCDAASTCCATRVCWRELLPTVAQLSRSPSATARWRRLLRAGPGQHRSARCSGQAGDADASCSRCCCTGRSPRSSRSSRRRVARHRHDRRCRGPRGARRAGAHLASRSDSRSACARCSRRNRASSSRAAGARCACWSSRASAPASTCCCCARDMGLASRELADLVDAGAGSLADRSRSHGRCAGCAPPRPAGESGGGTPAAAPPASGPRTRTRGLMNAAA